MTANFNKPIELSNPREIVRAVSGSNEYMVQRNDNPANAFAGAALLMSRNPELVPRNVLELKIASLLPGYLDAKLRLDNTDQIYASLQDRNTDLDKIIPMNHALKELIDANQRLTMPTVKNFVGGLMLQTEGPVRAEQAKGVIGSTLNGMRHEIAAENTFWQLPADEVSNVVQATAEQEKEGIDLIVVYKGYQVPFDLKAREESADAANIRHGGKAYRAIYSGFTSEDFGNGFRVDEEATQKQISRYRQELEQSVFERFQYLRLA